MDRDNTIETMPPDILPDTEELRSNLIELEEAVNKALQLQLEFLELWSLVIASYLGMVMKGANK